jgi:hypothetical protein
MPLKPRFKTPYVNMDMTSIEAQSAIPDWIKNPVYLNR